MILSKFILIDLFFIKKIIYILFKTLIIFNIYLLKKKHKDNYIIFNRIAFGDTFSNCVENYYKILNSGKKILTKSSLENKIVKFFFPGQNLKLFFSVPSFVPFYSINHLLNKNDFFNKSITKNYIVDSNKIKSSLATKKIIFNLLKKNKDKISSEIKKIKKKSYVLMHIKHYTTNVNNLDHSSPRSTSNLEKITKIVKFLKNKKINIIFLGNKYDLSIRKLKKIICKDVIFFEDLTKTQSIIDQLYIHYNSKLCIGNQGGSFIISMYLKKKIIFIDTLVHIINKYPMNYEKNITNIFKKIILKGKKTDLTDLHVKKVSDKNLKYRIIECSFNEIKKNLKKYL